MKKICFVVLLLSAGCGDQAVSECPRHGLFQCELESQQLQEMLEQDKTTEEVKITDPPKKNLYLFGKNSAVYVCRENGTQQCWRRIPMEDVPPIVQEYRQRLR
jgi:hypothetical protein